MARGKKKYNVPINTGKQPEPTATTTPEISIIALLTFR